LTPAADPFILGRQVDLLYRNLRQGQIVSILNASFLIWIAAPMLPMTMLGGWWLVATCFAGLRIALAARYARCSEIERQNNATFWHQRAWLGAAGSGLVWAAGAILLMLAGDTTLQLFAAFVMAGMVAGAVPVLSADRRVFRAYAWPVVLAVAISGFAPDPLHLSLTVMALLFLVVATRSADYFHETLLESLRLEHEKDGLVLRLDHALEVAEQSNRAKTEFLANISHELRTPLNGIVGLGELLSLDELTPSQAELLTPLRQSADDLMRMINNLIELSGLEAGYTKPSAAPFIAAELGESLFASHRAAARQRGLAMHEEIDAALPQVMLGDVGCLRQIFVQLLGNAIKFTESGRIDLAIRLQERRPDRALVEFSVSDSGPGIPPQTLKLLEGLLVQADGSSVRRHGGIGVGLSIARKLIELLGGELRIESQPGVGSRFSFVLPFEIPAENGPAA